MPFDLAMSEIAAARSLADLLPAVGPDVATVPVSGIAYDSRRVRPGNVFFALPGLAADGTTFAAQAVAAGASAVVAEKAVAVDAPVVVVENARRALAEASLRFWNYPDRDVKLTAVVGTNGKSTVAAGIEAVWTQAGVAAGMVGTLHYRWGRQSMPAQRTTPEAPELIGLIDRMRTDGVESAAVEVSSHAVALDRVWGICFAGAVFTNLTRDHLDFHGTFDEYRRVKTRLFERLESGDSFAAINVDDPSAEHFLQAAKSSRIIRYSVTGDDADVTLKIETHTLQGTTGRLVIAGTSWPFSSPLWGEFNHSNLAAVAAAAWGSGLDGERIARGLEAFPGVTGRLECIDSTAPFRVFVDYAHTPDALNAVLSSARSLVGGRLLVVFGCGGDRDRGKRPEMARAVERWADQIYLTSDNPRSEDPQRIIADVKKGFAGETPVWCDPDRVCAIERSIADAAPGDAVLLCGKGHEETQEIAGVFHRLSDRETAVRVLAAKGHSPQIPRGRNGSIPGSAVGPGGDPSPTRM